MKGCENEKTAPDDCSVKGGMVENEHAAAFQIPTLSIPRQTQECKGSPLFSRMERKHGQLS